MAEQRRRLRFRFPWQQATPAPPRPQRTPLPPQADNLTGPTQPTTTTPAQRPPFRSPGVAPPQAPPPPRAQSSPRTKPQPSSTSTATTRSRRSRVTPQPVSSPSRASTQSRGASQSPSPSRVANESESSAQPPSPSQQPLQAEPQPQTPPPKLVSQPSGEISSLPPSSPSLTATQAQPGQGETVPLPSENLQSRTQSPVTFQPSSAEPIFSVSEEDTKPARSEPESPELQPKVETTSENVQNAQNQTQSQLPFQPSEMSAENSEASIRVMAPMPTSTAAEETPVLTEKSDYSPVNTETKSLQTIEREEVLHEHGSKVGAAGSEAATEMHPSVSADAEQKQLEKEEVNGTKETISNSSSQGKEDQIVILNLKDKTTVSESRHKPHISNGPHKEIRDDTPKFVHEMGTHQQKHPLASVVTLAGENRGASMQLGSELAKREGTVHIRRGYKINPDETTTDGEKGSEGKRLQDSKTGEDQEPKAYINSNVQGINNSIMFNSSITERDPGVQLALSCDPTEPSKQKSMESTVITAQKLTYEPTVRRRCLRGLFMEPSNLDPDNPEKPSLHGCRYFCKEGNKENEIDVL